MIKKVFNVRIECNTPKFVMTHEAFCKGLEEVIADEFGDEMKYVKLKAEHCDKDQQITDLKQQLAEKNKENEVLHRALELACKELRDEYCRNCDAVSYECEMEICDHVWNMYPKQEFIEKAKEQRDD